MLINQGLKMKRNKSAETLALLIEKKFISMFGEEGVDRKALSQNAQDLADRFSWNMGMAKKNLEILSRQVWMRLKD